MQKILEKKVNKLGNDIRKEIRKVIIGFER